MLIDTRELRVGCILSKDVLSKTNRPIVLQDTIITKELLQVLHAFLIKEVDVERTMVNGEMLLPSEGTALKDGDVASASKGTFTDAYLQSVQEYKNLFKGWQAGNQVSVPKVRELFIPLLNQALSNEQEILSLHRYSTKEEYIYHHAISVGLLSGYLAKKMNFNIGDLVQIAIAGCLCDAGMAKVPVSILEKKTSLTREEFIEMKKHPIHSFRMLEKSSILRKEALVGILQHHERLDGSGYPKGDKGRMLHTNSRIIGLADVFHAMTSERLYRKRQSPYRGIEMIMHDDFGKFDIEAVHALMAGVIQIAIGTRVKLSNGYEGEVIFVHSQYPTRPTVKIEGLPALVDLNKERDLHIERTI